MNTFRSCRTSFVPVCLYDAKQSWPHCVPSLKVNSHAVCACVRLCNSWFVHICNLDVTVFSNRCKCDAYVYLNFQFGGM